jgi:hypothetical protein
MRIAASPRRCLTFKEGDETDLHGEEANEAGTLMSASLTGADQDQSTPAYKKEYEGLVGILLYLAGQGPR